jgi:hypothetical protein
LLHFVSGVTTGVLARYYYNNNGDTLMYFDGSRIINEVFFENPPAVFNFLSLPEEEQITYSYAYPEYWYFTNSTTTKVIQLCAPLYILTGGSYIGIGLMLSLFAAWGCWRTYKTFLYFYPELYKPLAYALLFIPSVLFWGSGILKDPISLGGLGIFFYAATNFFIFKRKRATNVGMMTLGFTASYIIKPYIIFLFVPVFAFWLLLRYKGSIKSAFVRKAITPILFLAGGVFGYFFIMSYAATTMFNVQNLGEDIKKQMEDYKEYSDKGFVDLGTIDPSPSGIAKMIPKSVNAVLLRPYIWEARNFLQIISGFENAIIGAFFFYTLFKVGIIRTFKTIGSNNMLLLCVLYTLIFAIVVGITTFNFGSISRYRIPCMPFFTAAIVLTYYLGKPIKTTKTSDINE